MKSRVKLYKAGKLWVTALVAAMGIFVAVNGVNADQVNSQTTNLQTTQIANTTNNIPSNINGYTKQQGQNGTAVWKNSNGQSLNGWESTDANTWYRFNNGTAATGWQNVNNNWYYMNKSTSAMETGIQKINNNTYYLNTNHDGSYGAMKTGWQYVGNNWYHFKNDGAADTGWNNINGNEYYFNQSNAKMATGDTNINGSNYYFEPGSGHQVKGLVLDSNSHTLKYYDPSTGARQTTLNSNGKTYTFDAQSGNINANGLNNGLNQIAGHTYFYNAANNTFVSNDWRQVNNQWYHFDNNGAANTGWFQSGAKNWFYFNNDGSAKTGWFQSAAGNWYYFDPANAWALRGWQQMDNNWFYFDPVNAWQYKGWTKVNGQWFYLDDQGHMLTGLQKINGQFYDLQTEHDGNYGAMKTGWQKVNGHWSYFNNSGNAATGWFKSGAGNWYYFNPANAGAETGWQKINGHWYYFDNQNAWALKNWQNINNHWYYFDPTNAWADTGWQKINGHWYYMDPTNAWMLTGTQQINGKTYKFNSDGSWADTNSWAWPFPQDGEGHFMGAQLFGVHPGGEFRQNGFHDGLDFGSIDHPGREVHAVHGGTVKLVGYIAGLDWYTVVDTGEYLIVYQEAFANRSDIKVHEGQQINTGDVIGIRDTAHVHIGITRDHNFNRALRYSFTNNGTWLDPEQVIRNGIKNN